jgi:hypothetical protein
VASALQTKIINEIKKAKNELKPSVFNEIANKQNKVGGMSVHVE